jgi:hypothetical protein
MRAAARRVALRQYLRGLQWADRARLRRLLRAHSGLEIDPTASSNLGCALFELGEGARLRIGAGVETDRLPRQLEFRLGPGADVEVGAGSWLRTDIEKIRIVAFAGARVSVGPDSWWNGCQVSANAEIVAGEGSMIGPGTRVFDSNHALDDETPARARPVRIGAFTWLGADVTVLQGVEIGAHSVVGARSVVTKSVPPHTLALGAPAVARGRVGERRAFM